MTSLPRDRAESTTALFERYMDDLRYVLATRVDGLLGPRLRAFIEPDDVLHDVALRALPAFCTRPVHEPRAFIAWFTCFAQNEIRNIHRRFQAKVRPRHAASLALDAIQFGDDDNHEQGSAPAKSAPFDVAVRRLQHANTLGWDQRLVVTLKDQLDMRWPTVSFLMGDRSLPGIRKIRSRAASAD